MKRWTIEKHNFQFSDLHEIYHLILGAIILALLYMDYL